MSMKNTKKSLVLIGKTFKALNKKECKVLRLRYGLEDGQFRTLKEIAKINKVTKERIRQIEQIALNKIKIILMYED